MLHFTVYRVISTVCRGISTVYRVRPMINSVLSTGYRVRTMVYRVVSTGYRGRPMVHRVRPVVYCKWIFLKINMYVVVMSMPGFLV